MHYKPLIRRFVFSINRKTGFITIFAKIYPIVVYRTETDIRAAINHKKLVWLMAARMSVLIESVTYIQADTLILCLRTVSLSNFSLENSKYVMGFRL